MACAKSSTPLFHFVLLIMLTMTSLIGGLTSDAQAQPQESSLMFRGGADLKGPQSGYGMDLMMGSMVGGSDDRPALILAGRKEWRSSRRFTLDVTLTGIRIEGTTQASWRTHCDESCVIRCPAGDAFEGVGSRDLEIGSTTVLIPGLEWTFCRSNKRQCLRPSIFVGLGLRYDAAQSTAVSDRRVFTVESNTQPVISWGVALNKPFRYGWSWRLEVRQLTTLDDEGSVRTQEGELASSMFLAESKMALSIGLRHSF